MTRPNVLYVTIDSIRADHVGHQGYERETTPTLDRLANRGTVCMRATANGIPTYYSFKSLLAGIPSLGYSEDVGVPTEATTLAEVLRDQGYATAGFNAGNPWLTRGYGYDRGFETFRDYLTDDHESETSFLRRFDPVKRRLRDAAERNEFVRDKAGFTARLFCALTDRTPLEPAETVTEAALEWLSERSDSRRPFFCWIHYMDPHYPWIPPGTHLDAFDTQSPSTFEKARLWHHASHLNGTSTASDDRTTAADVRKIRDLYDAELRRTDAAIGRVIAALESNGSLDETLVAVAGDHGTELADHGAFSHGPRTLYQEVIHVPLVMAGPRVPERTVSTVTSLTDLPVSLLERARVPRDEFSDFGTSLFERQRERAFTEVVYDAEPASATSYDNGILASCLEWPWKLIVNRETGTHELYHLERDPGERENVAGERAVVADRLEDALSAYRRRVERYNNTVREKARIRATVDEMKRRGVV